MNAAKLIVGMVVAGASLTLSSVASRAHEEEQTKVVFERSIPNISGKSLIAVLVSYPPGARSVPHRHAKSAFIYAQVLSGAIRSQVDDGSVRIYRVGEGFHETPGSYHTVSENASDGEPASLLAVFVVDTNDVSLTLPDRK